MTAPGRQLAEGYLDLEGVRLAEGTVLKAVESQGFEGSWPSPSSFWRESGWMRNLPRKQAARQGSGDRGPLSPPKFSPRANSF